MRRRVFPFLIILSAAAGSLVLPAAAQDTLLGGPRPPASSDRVVRSAIPPDRAKALDADFAALAAAQNPGEARAPERRILAALNHSGSDTVDLLMGWAGAALTARNYAEALDLLDQVLILDPDYAEGYNRRATVYYALDDYTQSMRDIRFTLALEPRHFGALSGLAAILRELGDDERAAEIYRRILAIHPTMEAPKTELEKLESSVKGSPT
jgi:tetratricopeptide (TPR) repeat protein